MPPAGANAARPLPEENTVRYLIDVRGSTFNVKGSSTGVLSAFGHDPTIAIHDFWGDVEFSPGTASLEDARVLLHIRAGSLEVAGDINEKDRTEIQRRMLDEVLQANPYPEIFYECSRVTGSGNGERYWLALSGELTLKGVTRPAPVMTRVVVNDSSVRASGEFVVKMSDFGIPPVTAVGGAIRLKDELKCTFDIVARKQA
jgi:polyisoprenoid-binding protein YceI